jgi:PadR family transcriptional regulator, regulatory protein PadR
MYRRGNLTLLVLHVLSAGPSHGYAVAQEVKRRSAGALDFKEGTLYPALHDLERRGLVASYEAREHGRTRRYYELSEAGHAALAHERTSWRQYVRAVDAVLGEAV